jgi:hypothetical protein
MITQQEKDKLKREINSTINIIERDDVLLYLTNQINGVTHFNDGVVCAPVYLFATEYISGYNSNFNKMDSYLTVGGSGDQVINAILKGAKEIDVFDCNPLVKRAIALKVASIKSLDRDKFIKYYDTFLYKFFDMIKSNLSETDLAYWSSLYEYAEAKDIYEQLFAYKKNDMDEVIRRNNYLMNQEYDKCQKLINDVHINYLDADFYNLEKYIKNKKYDAINLSNIYEYIVYNNFDNEGIVNAFYKYVMDNLYTRLNDDGKIMLSYLYAFSYKAKEYVEELYKKNPNAVAMSGALSLFKYGLYEEGLTAQNLSYCKLLDIFKDDNIEVVETNPVGFGQSIDMSHDMALFLKK